MKPSVTILHFSIIILLVLLIGSSYVRFMVNYDYLISYELECSPETTPCFIGCEDEECSEEYYYTKIEKYAADLRRQCGVDITDCENSYYCLAEGDSQCSITYCNPDVDECSEIKPSVNLNFTEENNISPEFDNTDI